MEEDLFGATILRAGTISPQVSGGIRKQCVVLRFEAGIKPALISSHVSLKLMKQVTTVTVATPLLFCKINDY